jgi:hypothetical protein
MVTHSTGVMWLALVVAVIALLQPLSRWRELFQRSSRALTGAGAVIAVGGVATMAWLLLAKTNALGPAEGKFEQLELTHLVVGQFAWTLQTIAAFPLRSEAAPGIVYALWLVPFVSLLVAGIRCASPRLRIATLVLLTVWVAVPMALTVVSFDSEGLAWQGRYALPLAVGFPALAGLALHRSTRSPRGIHCVTAVTLCALAQTISCVSVAWTEAGKDLAPSFAGSFPGSVVLIAALAMTGAMLPLLLARSYRLPVVEPVQSRPVVEVGT